MDKTEPILRILEQVPVPVVIASPLTAKILWVNQRLVSMYGVERPSQVVGMSLLDFIQVHQAARALADLAKVVAGASPPPVTYQLKRFNGEFAAGQVSSVPMMFHGQPAMLSFVTDVSERERLVQALRDSEERYRLLLDELPSGVVVVIDDHIVWANRSLASALGFEPAEQLVDRSIYRSIDPAYHARFRDARQSVMLSGEQNPPMPVVMVRRDGSKFQTTVSTTRIRWEGTLASQTLMYDVAASDPAGAPSRQ